MNAATCSSALQCRLNGMFGTLTFVSAAALAWVLFDSGLSGMAMMLPALGAVGVAAALKILGRHPGWLSLGLSVVGAVWAVIALNTLESL
ncbi:hypothetical protein SAMN06265173_11094 [Thalassovita litoralis]|jgi:hypothetical protein|uniref:Uncharacterized protein n=1 Tax=Thalassovita litoralis TaxID=1010611 RepID=A0A521DEW1_9RHOB|nr:hypothetical protein [Thalassovita litoralis]SMO70277.1 hypothetical protein SAMN06265173_11094 [Thalassovita litoralis]